MLQRPPSPDRAGFDCAAFSIGSHLKHLFRCVKFDPTELSEVGRPGPHHGTARCGGDTYAFAIKLFAREVMSKFDDEVESSAQAKTDTAIRRFEEAEQLCAATNERFHKYLMGHRPANEQVTRVMLRAREKIGRLLANMDWERVRAGCTYTQGSSVLLARGKSTPIHKYSAKVESTNSALSTVSEIFSQIPALMGGFADGSGYIIVPGNKLTCVEKNYKTYRTIAGEASGQMYAQKGLHKEIRRRLKQVGVNLDSQVQNQDWALLGSRTGLVATVDMSMASDTVAQNVTEWMFSLVPDVFSYLDRLRSTHGKFADRMVTYEKHSSMGNANTFEVETTIFWALATAVCDISKADSRFVGVYGDDVVIPNRCASLFLDVLEECGFVPNRDKTFWEERPHPLQKRFRESCGKQYFNGEDVTPVYIRRQPKSLLDYFLLVNNLVRWLRTLERISDAPCLKEAWAYVDELRARAPEAWIQPRIPDGYGDGAFIGTFDEVQPQTYKGRKSMWVEGYRVEVLAERSDKAIGRSSAGFPLVWRKATKKVGRLRVSVNVMKALEDGKLKKHVKGVSATGFALASLEHLERRGTSVLEYRSRKSLWFLHGLRTAQYHGLRELALAVATEPLTTEGASIDLPSTRQVAITTMTIPRSVAW